MTDQEVFTGQKVWLENRKHDVLPNWMDCYGVIVNVIHDWDDGDGAEILQVVASFESGSEEFIDVEYLNTWDDRSQCWMLYGYPS